MGNTLEIDTDGVRSLAGKIRDVGDAIATTSAEGKAAIDELGEDFAKDDIGTEMTKNYEPSAPLFSNIADIGDVCDELATTITGIADEHDETDRNSKDGFDHAG